MTLSRFVQTDVVRYTRKDIGLGSQTRYVTACKGLLLRKNVKTLVSLFALLMALVCGTALAAPQGGGVNEAQVKLNLIHQMQDDGYLSEKLAREAVQKYVDPKQLSAPVTIKPAGAVTASSESLWMRYVSWVNAVKVVGILFILVAFWGVIRNIIKGIWHLLVTVPVVVYQLPLLAVSVTLTVRPDLIWASQALYLAIFGSVANILLLGWVAVTNEKLALFVLRLFRLGLPPASVGAFWGMVYFGALALLYHSPIFGFAAAVCLSGVFSFGMYYSRGTLWLDFKDNAEAAVVLGHLVVLLAYVVARAKFPQLQALTYFSAGLEYYCTIAMCVGLLVGSAPMVRKHETVGLYVVLFIAIAVAASLGYFILDLRVIGSIVMCFFILFCLEWLGYWGFQGGLIAGCAVLGVSLFGLSVLLEHYGKLIVLSMV